jgi:hypothetical protein
MSERKPTREDNPFLAYDNKYRSYSPIFMCAYDTRYGKEFYDWQTEEDMYPSHWMPLPKPPEE